MGEIVGGKQNVETERDYGTNCRDCERFQRVGEVCVIEHGKRFLWEYCRDFEAKVELPDYNELMKTVKQEHALQRHKEREKKEREKKQRLKEREARKEQQRRARIARARRKYFAKLKKKKAAAEKRKKAREEKKRQQLESPRQQPATSRQRGADSEVATAVALDFKTEPKLRKTKELADSNPFSKGKKKKTAEDYRRPRKELETKEEEIQNKESKTSVKPKEKSVDRAFRATTHSKEKPSKPIKESEVVVEYEKDPLAADRQQF